MCERTVFPGFYGRADTGVMAHLLRVGIDLDDTATDAPAFFAALSGMLLASGHEVHIVTYRPDSSAGAIASDLEALGLRWTAIHHPEGFGEASPVWKRRIALDVGLHVLIDDARENLVGLPEGVVGLQFIR